MNRNIIILGVGGHGWESLSEVILNSDDNITLYGSTADWGGFTGCFGRLLEMNNNELNLTLHSRPLSVMPYGDFNKIISWFVAQKFDSSTAQILDYRSYSIDGHFQEFLKLIAPFSLTIDQTRGYLNYITTFFNYYEEHSEELNYSKEPCLSTLLHSYIASDEGIVGLNKFYHNLGIIPVNVKMAFSSQNRQILIGESAGISYVGEDTIDVLTQPIIPASLQFVDVDLVSKTVSPELLSDLISAHRIIIPNGSIANWLPLLNHTEVRSVLIQKSQVMYVMLNLFHTKNEFPINTYIEYLDSVGILPNVVLPYMDAPLATTNTIQRYKLEGKTINYPEFLQQVIDFIQNPSRVHSVLCQQSLSFKYQTKSVAETLLALIK
jgi:hypothetical protein